MRALIVDDSRAMRTILKRMLAELGHDSVEAAHGAEALARLQEVGPLDVALVDWNMPEMNGFEFVKAVRSDNRYGAMPLVMVTTESDQKDVLAALEAGANEYVMKPFSKEVMQEKLALLGITAV